MKCAYLPREEAKNLYRTYDEILRLLVSMINHPEQWVIGYGDRSIQEEAEDYDTLF